MKKGDFVNGKGELEGFIIQESKKAYLLNIIWNKMDLWITKSWIKSEKLTSQIVAGNQVYRFQLHQWAIPKFSIKMKEKINKIKKKKYWKSKPGFMIPTEEESTPIEQRRQESKNIVVKYEQKNCSICKKEYEYAIGSELGSTCSIVCFNEYRKL